MKQIILAATLAATPLAATAENQTAEGLSLMERGALMVLESLLEEAEPTISDFAETMQELGPQMRELGETHGPQLRELLTEMGDDLLLFMHRVDDLRHYQAPEFLPNGDIILRRKPNAPSFEPEGAVDL